MLKVEGQKLRSTVTTNYCTCPPHRSNDWEWDMRLTWCSGWGWNMSQLCDDSRFHWGWSNCRLIRITLGEEVRSWRALQMSKGILLCCPKSMPWASNVCHTESLSAGSILVWLFCYGLGRTGPGCRQETACAWPSHSLAHSKLIWKTEEKKPNKI